MEKSLKSRALDLLSRREYSRKELEKRLTPHAESIEQLTSLLDELNERHWLSDQRFAEQVVTAKGKKYGSLRLKQELKEKGVAKEEIEQALEAQDDFSTARQAWAKKFGAPPATQQERAKQMRFLAARGFPMPVIQKVINATDDDNYQDNQYD